MRYAPIPGVAFVHMPKNAGQSVRNALKAVTVEPRFTDEAVEEIHPGRPALKLLSGRFQASSAALATAHNFAMTRVPRARFVSALMPRMKEFDKAGDLHAEAMTAAKILGQTPPASGRDKSP